MLLRRPLSLQNTILELHLGSVEVLAPVDEPLRGTDEKPDGEGHDAVVHVGPGDGEVGREDEEDCGDDDVDDADDVADPAEGTGEDEGARRKSPAALEAVHCDWHGVARGC